MGLANASQLFQRAMHNHSKTGHVHHLEIMFICLRYILGYIVSEQGLRADPDKVSAIVKMQTPDNLKQVTSFLDMAGYHYTCMANLPKVGSAKTAGF